jgi:hypothetical protein
VRIGVGGIIFIRPTIRFSVSWVAVEIERVRPRVHLTERR